MSTAVASTTEKIRNLLVKADIIQEQIDKLLGERAQVMADVRDTADSGSGDYQINATPAPAQAQAATPAPAKATTKKVANGRKKSENGRKKVVTKSANGRKSSGQRKTKLREVLWDVMDRSPIKWRKILPDLEKGARGLRLIEIVKIITDEGKWFSKSADISPQVSNCIKSFRDQGKMARGDGVRYYIVGGAEIDGPSLDEKGDPIPVEE